MMIDRVPVASGWRHRELRHRVALLATGALIVFAVACAQPGAPPGGPPDAELPVLLKVLPESNAVNVRTPAVVMQFDEVISERSAGAGVRAAGSGTNSLNSVLVLSPSDGRDEVVWRRTVLELRPRRGFRPNTTYRVTLNPGLADLRGNQTTEAFDFVFSTGPTAASGEVRGVLFDWTTGKPALNARVDLYRDADSTFRWSARTDSTGRFRVRDLDAGSYELRAWVDANNDRRISFREISDSTRVTLTDTVSLELYAYVRDTLPSRIENVELVDSTGIRVRFDRGIVYDWDGVGATLLAADSSEIPLAGPMVASAQFDSLAKLRRAAADSAAKVAADSAARVAADSAGADTTTADTLVIRVPRAETDSTPAERSAADRAAADSAAADSVAADTLPPAPVFGRKVPEVSWTVPLNAPLAPGAYRIRIRGARGLNGREVDTDREFRVREAPPPAPADTTTPPSTEPTTPPTTPPATPPATPSSTPPATLPNAPAPRTPPPSEIRRP